MKTFTNVRIMRRKAARSDQDQTQGCLRNMETAGIRTGWQVRAKVRAFALGAPPGNGYAALARALMHTRQMRSTRPPL